MHTCFPMHEGAWENHFGHTVKNLGIGLFRHKILQAGIISCLGSFVLRYYISEIVTKQRFINIFFIFRQHLTKTWHKNLFWTDLVLHTMDIIIERVGRYLLYIFLLNGFSSFLKLVGLTNFKSFQVALKRLKLDLTTGIPEM